MGNAQKVSKKFTTTKRDWGNGKAGALGEEVFHQFLEEYGTWLKSRARALSVLKGIDRDDAEQNLAQAAWIACTKTSYDGTRSKSMSAINWVRQGVLWEISRIFREKDLRGKEFSLENYGSRFFNEYNDDQVDRALHSALGKKDKGSIPGEDGIALGSITHSSNQRRVEARSLLRATYNELKKMEGEGAKALLLLFEPSFDMELSIIFNEANTKTAGSRYEFCTLDELICVTGVSQNELKKTVSALWKRIPEIRDFFNENEFRVI